MNSLYRGVMRSGARKACVKHTNTTRQVAMNDSSAAATTKIRRSTIHTTSVTQQDAPNKPYISGDSTHFGYETVKVEEKQDRVKDVFASVADSYDVMNDFMSGGLHRYWKDYLLQLSMVDSIAKTVRSRQISYNILDVAGGTGDVAFRFVDASGCLERARSSGRDEISVTVCDINADMLRVGQDRAREKYGDKMVLDDAATTGALQFVQGDAQDLHQFDDNSFDLYTIAFGLRNVTNVDQALKEANRVLKPGGRFMCLEFSHVPNKYMRAIYDAYSFNVIPTMGEIVANDRASYQYLVESIRQFPKQDELVGRMRQAGMRGCKYTNLTNGIVAIHQGYKGL